MTQKLPKVPRKTEKATKRPRTIPTRTEEFDSHQYIDLSLCPSYEVIQLAN